MDSSQVVDVEPKYLPRHSLDLWNCSDYCNKDTSFHNTQDPRETLNRTNLRSQFLLSR